MSATICGLAANLPLVISHLLTQEAKLKRGRFREETMTDILTGALAAFAGPNLVIEYPIEDQTGGDLDLRFWHAASAEELCVRLQAKRLNAATEGGTDVKLANRSYSQLMHKAPTAPDYQFRVLRDAPKPWLPLYMFYNHQDVVQSKYFAGAPTVSGINLAFATDVAAELDAKLVAAAGKPKKVLHHKRLAHLRKHFFELAALLCPGDDWRGEPVPPPDVVAASLRKRYFARDGDRKGSDVDQLMRILLEPAALSARREPWFRLPDGPAVRFSRRIERLTLTFISGRTDDERTPVVRGGAAQLG